MTKTLDPPAGIEVGDDLHLRLFEERDAEEVARAVGESLEHLKPWMPWADAQSADPAFQRERLRKLPGLARRQEEWQYGLFGSDDARVLGSFGLMTRRGPGTLEIGYWLHVDVTGRGYATRAVDALTVVACTLPDVRQVLIFCDEANDSSAAIPRRLGYKLVRVDSRIAEAPGETGRQMMWARPGET